MTHVFRVDVCRAKRGGFHLPPISLELVSGEVLGITGENGTGKTTFLDVLSGFVSFEGKLSWRGRDIKPWPPWRRHLEIMSRSFQNSESTVSGTSVLRVAGYDPHNKQHASSLALLLSGVNPRSPLAELSLGQAKRMLLVAALARRRPVLLLDEPFDGLDDDAVAATKAAVCYELSKGGIVVLVDHRRVSKRVDFCKRWLQFKLDNPPELKEE